MTGSNDKITATNSWKLLRFFRAVWICLLSLQNSTAQYMRCCLPLFAFPYLYTRYGWEEVMRKDQNFYIEFSLQNSFVLRSLESYTIPLRRVSGFWLVFPIFSTLLFGYENCLYYKMLFIFWDNILFCKQNLIFLYLKNCCIHREC